MGLVGHGNLRFRPGAECARAGHYTARTSRGSPAKIAEGEHAGAGCSCSCFTIRRPPPDGYSCLCTARSVLLCRLPSECFVGRRSPGLRPGCTADPRFGLRSDLQRRMRNRRSRAEKRLADCQVCVSALWVAMRCTSAQAQIRGSPSRHRWLCSSYCSRRNRSCSGLQDSDRGQCNTAQARLRWF